MGKNGREEEEWVLFKKEGGETWAEGCPTG